MDPQAFDGGLRVPISTSYRSLRPQPNVAWGDAALVNWATPGDQNAIGVAK